MCVFITSSEQQFPKLTLACKLAQPSLQPVQSLAALVIQSFSSNKKKYTITLTTFSGTRLRMSQLHTAQTLPVVPFRASCEINKQHLAQVPSSAQTTQRFGVSRGLISRRPTTTVAIFSPSLGVVPRTHTTTPAENNTPPKFPQLNLDRAGERERRPSTPRRTPEWPIRRER